LNYIQFIYSYYGFTDEAFNSVCTSLLESSEIYNKENEFISKLSQENLLALLKVYNIPNYGELFNTMMVKKLENSYSFCKECCL